MIDPQGVAGDATGSARGEIVIDAVTFRAGGRLTSLHFSNEPVAVKIFIPVGGMIGVIGVHPFGIGVRIVGVTAKARGGLRTAGEIGSVTVGRGAGDFAEAVSGRAVLRGVPPIGSMRITGVASIAKGG